MLQVSVLLNDRATQYSIDALSSVLVNLSSVVLTIIVPRFDFFSLAGYDVGEHRKSAPRGHRNVECADVRVLDLLHPLLHNQGVLVKQVLIACLLFVEVREVRLGVLELAAGSIFAEALLSVGLAQGHAELLGDMCLFDELIFTVSESALVTEGAVKATGPLLAHLCLLLLLVLGFSCAAIFIMFTVAIMGALLYFVIVAGGHKLKVSNFHAQLRLERGLFLGNLLINRLDFVLSELVLGLEGGCGAGHFEE